MAYSLSFFFGQCRDLQKVFGCMQILKFDFLWIQFFQRLGYVIDFAYISSGKMSSQKTLIFM